MVAVLPIDHQHRENAGDPAIRVVHMMRMQRPRDFSIEGLFRVIRGHMPTGIDVEVFTCRNLSKGLLPRIADMLAATRFQSDINHVTGDVHYLTFLLESRRTVLTIHDLAHLSRLQGLKRWLYWLFWLWIPVQRCGAITVISEETKRQLLRNVRCNEQKVHVIYNAVSPEFQPVPYHFNAERPRILQIGTHWNKNLERVIEALSGITCQLVIIGTLSEQQVELLKRHKLEYQNHFGLQDSEVVAQYAACDLLVFASTHEGFGLPILEANAIGRPVITSNLSSMPEVAGQSACLVDPYDIMDIRRGILRVMSDEACRNSLIEEGFENVKRFGPAVAARAYANLYARLYRDLGARRIKHRYGK